MARIESYNPERSPELVEGQSRRIRNMAEGTSGPGPEGGPTGPQTGPAKIEGLSTPRKSPFEDVSDDVFNQLLNLYPDANVQATLEKLTAEQRRIVVDQALAAIRDQQPRQTNQGGTESNNTPTETNSTGQTSEATPVAEPRPAAGSGGSGERGGGGGNKEGPRGPRSPEMGEEEWEVSPERGRWIVEQIIKLEIKPYAERYKDKTGPLSTTDSEKKFAKEGDTYLDKLYKDLQSYVTLCCKIRQGGEDWDPKKEYEEPSEEKREFLDAYSQPIDQVLQLYLTNQETSLAPETLPIRSFEELVKISDDISKPEDECNKAQEELQIYFREAKRRGFLKGVDAILTSIYQENVRGQVTSDDIETILDRRIKRAEDIGEVTFKRLRGEPEISKFSGMWREYISRAKELFTNILTGQEQVPRREGEFDPGQEQEVVSRETYWRPSTYPDYYVVTATTEDQFLRAKESFLQMIKGGSLGRSPDKILPHLENFAKAFGQAGLIQELAGNVRHGFIEEERLEYEGLSYIYGADYTNETYNPENYYKFMMALALHEGPQRWVRLARAGQGQVGAFLWKFDNDPRIALFYNSGGSRGQISNDTLTQNYLQSQIKEIIIEEGMGVQLKDYDPDDKSDEPERSLGRNKVNLERIGIHQPEGAFKGLYEGFDIEEQDKFYREKIEPKLTKLMRAQLIQEQVDAGVNIFPLTEEDRKIYTSFIEKQLLTPYEEKLYRIMRVKQLLRRGKRLNELNKHDRKVYDDAHIQSATNFEIAYQMVGATGEKVRRGGGVFYIDRASFVDHMPVYLANKFVQYAETRIKIQYANSSAKERAERVAQARKYAIQQIKQYGFEAKLVLPEVNSDKDGNVIGTGKNETIDFQTAVKSIYSRWTSHTYWGYQQENRHMLLAPHILEAAKRIRAGKSQPEDEDLLATQLLIVDPTLKRVKRLPGDQMGIEVMLLEAAVEESYQGHWRIDRELFEAFLPEDGDANKIRVGYNREDFGGISRHIIAVKEYVAAHPKRFSRRFAAELAHVPMHISSYPDILGQDGMLGLISMFADPIGRIADQRVASQFSITKFVNQMRYGSMMFGFLYGYEDSEKGISVEGLYEKPTNNSDKLVQYYNQMNTVRAYPDAENKFFYELMETFGRLDKVLKLMRVMESDVRNAQGALLTEKDDIFSSDGKFNRELATEESRNTGSGRHSERIFFDSFVDWLMDTGPGGGARAYPSETAFYSHLDDEYFYFDAKRRRVTQKNPDGSTRTWRDWLFDKMCR